ncbi:MAG: hypothetical protein QOH16_700 [Gaiellaceae bacterium]|nr:hypothetical protein [Gaiellaceae bacterium]
MDWTLRLTHQALLLMRPDTTPSGRVGCTRRGRNVNLDKGHKTADKFPRYLSLGERRDEGDNGDAGATSDLSAASAATRATWSSRSRFVKPMSDETSQRNSS